MSAGVTTLITVAMLAGFLAGGLLGLWLMVGGKAEREKRREDRMVQSALRRFPDFSTERLRLYAEGLERESESAIAQHMPSIGESYRERAIRARLELARRLSAGEVQR